MRKAGEGKDGPEPLPKHVTADVTGNAGPVIESSTASMKEEGPACKKKANRGVGGKQKQAASTPTSPPSPLPPVKCGREGDVDDNDLKPPASKVPANTSLKSSSPKGSGKDIIDDGTDVDEEELPDSEPPDSGTTVAESSTTGAPSAGNSEHITECATAWSIISFVITSFYTAIHIAFALDPNRDRIYPHFYAMVLLPTCFTVLCISFALKLRRSDLPYMAFLSFQYLSFSIGSEILTFIVIGFKWTKTSMLAGFGRSIVWLSLLLGLLRLRSSFARLSDADLSKFLSMSVIKGGLIVGLGQLVFLAFSSVQCLNEAALEGHSWRECKRSLYSQTGFGGLIAEYTIIMLVSGVVPRKYIDRHIIKINKVATLDLNVKEVSALVINIF